MDDRGRTVWVLSPLPQRGMDPSETFLRVRLTAPHLAEQTAAYLRAVGGSAAGDAGRIVLAGTLAQFQLLASRAPDPVGPDLTTALAAVMGSPPTMELAGHRFEFARKVYVAGILNTTPDSFYDRGRFFGIEAALARADDIVREGADVIEVGGETARAGARLDPAVEIDRVVPLVKELVRRYALPVAVDTYKPDVARAAADAGAVLINDIAGLREPGMAEVVASAGAGVVIMHLHGRAKEPYQDPDVPSMMDRVAAFLQERIAAAEAAGIPHRRILVDPGLNFGKRPYRDLELMRRLSELRNLGCPIFVATSRKDYIRDLLALPPDELLEGTAAAVAFAVVQGANMLRVHDVQAMVRVVRMTEYLAGHHDEAARAMEEKPDVTAR